MTDHDPRADLPVPNRRPPGGTRGSGYVPGPVVEPGVVYEPPPPRRVHGDPAMRKDLGLVAFVAGILVIALVTWNLAGVVTSQAFTPRPASPVALAPTASPTSRASATAVIPSTAPSAPAEAAAPTPTPTPRRRPVDVRIEARPASVFLTELRDTWCAAAAVQIALNVNAPRSKIDTTRARQAAIRALEVDLTTRRDSRNGGAGPIGMVRTLERLGKVDYALHIHGTRAAALRDAARAISKTGNAAILLAWRGAHAWVMTGFRADADPTVFRNARVTGAYIIDPWYPRVSSIWGRSDKPGAFQNGAEMKRNFLPWRRPEGRYPGRDGRYLVIVPTS